MKTAMLMALMTMLLMAIGDYFGGLQGMTIMLVFGVAMNFFTYWNSDKMVLAHYNAQEVNARTAPRLYAIVKRLADRAKLPMPKVYIIDSPVPNAFATGRNPEHAAVAVNTALADLLDEDELRYQKALVNLYETIGYQCVEVCASTGKGLDAFLPSLKGKVTLLSGNSGVGKSTLINQILPSANQRTAEISSAHNTGMHTTTFSEMLSLPQGGYLIDTPGIKGFGTFDIEREELTSYFKEIFKFSSDCRFSNCTHTHEPGCAVRKAVEEHYIAESRYQSYLSMLDDKEENKYREAF